MVDVSFMEFALEGERMCKSGDFYRAVKNFEAAVEIGTKDLETLSTIYSQLGNAYFYLEDYGQSFEYHKHDLNLTRTAKFHLGEANACGNLGNTLKTMRRYDEAIVCCQRQIEIAKDLGNKICEAKALYNLGNIYHAKGKELGRLAKQDPGDFPFECQQCLRKAEEFYVRNLALALDLNDRAAQGRAYGSLGNTQYLLGNFNEAIVYHEKRLSVAKEFGDKSAERRAYTNLANACIFLGEFLQAVDMYSKTLHLSVAMGNKAFEAQACYSLGNTYLLLRDHEKAIEYYIRHLRIAHELKDRVGEGRACSSLGNIYRETGKPETALFYVKQHLEILKEISDENGQNLAKVSLVELQKLIGRENDVENMKERLRQDFDDLHNRSRRISMENLSLVSLTPDKMRSKSGLKEMNTNDMRIKKDLDMSLMQSLTPQKTMTSRLSEEDMDVDGLFELVSRFQSRRIDDQRCSSSLIVNRRHEKIRESDDDEKENRGGGAGFCVIPDDFFDMVAGIQGSRMNDQRIELCIGRGSSTSQKVLPQMGQGHQKDGDLETFFKMLIKCQGSRIDDQRGELPMKSFAPTIPDEDFISLIQRFQSNRLEEQRSVLPSANPLRNIPLPLATPLRNIPLPLATPAALPDLTPSRSKLFSISTPRRCKLMLFATPSLSRSKKQTGKHQQEN